MKHAGTQAIETERLILRKYRMTDADDMYRNWVADPEVSRFWSWTPHQDVEETRFLLAGWIKEYSRLTVYHWVIVLKETLQAVGSVFLDEINEAEQSVSVHYLLSRRLWNQGIATEACRSVMNFAFGIVGAEKIHSRHHVDNPASGRVLQKCGMHYVQTKYRQYPDCERISGDYRFYELFKQDFK